ncbi:unnamed protein product, partial [Prorocentrum cordatum]
EEEEEERIRPRGAHKRVPRAASSSGDEEGPAAGHRRLGSPSPEPGGAQRGGLTGEGGKLPGRRLLLRRRRPCLCRQGPRLPSSAGDGCLQGACPPPPAPLCAWPMSAGAPARRCQDMSCSRGGRGREGCRPRPGAAARAPSRHSAGARVARAAAWLARA